MIIFFSEQDLVSFGNYMVSDLRQRRYAANTELDADAIPGLLARVNEQDLADWAYIDNQQKQTTAQSESN